MIKLILVFLKIGLFAFGGGWSIVGLIQKELVDNKLLDYDDFINAVGIAQLTPGPLALNMATYTGYKLHGIIGAILATISLLIPSIVILILTILILDRLIKDNKILIQALTSGTVFLMIYSFYRMLQNANGDYKLLIVGFVSFLLFIKIKVHPIVIILASSTLYLLLGVFL